MICIECNRPVVDVGDPTICQDCDALMDLQFRAGDLAERAMTARHPADRQRALAALTDVNMEIATLRGRMAGVE